MKLLPDALQGPSITGYGPGWVAVNGQQYTTSLIVSSEGLCQPWSCAAFDQLDIAHFEELATLAPELVLFGSGDRIQFPRPQWLAPLYSRRIGLETMDTQAACRTFNFLAGEGRKVVAALLV
ncbi:Mth938-like domain-containing protein [Rhodoferax saidenbachensis]|uniref:Xcc1710-like domain-containing protein n=1 Tax=Rhodoferax saidenbachensis TaxID=1484693 RepID=A0ABU1ZKN4_9BURK|nr:Mth938-like domain-containing protein [Rhodoferax saidenbachensis]MDR7305440.1 uncharacterized protein [Rhodoferax saidenbachensis]